MTVAIQGERASFHHAAARQWFGDDVAIMSCNTFADVFDAIAQNNAEFGIVAIENTLAGSINTVYDLLERYNYPIIGEVHLPIHQQLIGSGDAEITHIFSHPVALAQCEAYLDYHYPNAQRIEHHDTAGAVEFIKQSSELGFAAIASKDAAQLYDMRVIAENIEDDVANFTRFLVIQPNGVVPENADRTSLVITTDHTPGALARVLTQLAERGINLSKLQSRPIVGKPWHYRFYLVLNIAGPELHEALRVIKPITTSIAILGEYHHNPTE